MNRVTITIHVDLPDNLVPSVDYGASEAGIQEARRMEWEAEVPKEPPYLMDTGYDPDQIVRPTAAPAPACPVHGKAMERWPAGVSKKPPYKAYNASWRCPVKGCETKPIWDRDAA